MSQWKIMDLKLWSKREKHGLLSTLRGLITFFVPLELMPSLQLFDLLLFFIPIKVQVRICLWKHCFSIVEHVHSILVVFSLSSLSMRSIFITLWFVPFDIVSSLNFSTALLQNFITFCTILQCFDILLWTTNRQIHSFFYLVEFPTSLSQNPQFGQNVQKFWIHRIN